jgi:hypothetical protein
MEVNIFCALTNNIITGSTDEDAKKKDPSKVFQKK